MEQYSQWPFIIYLTTNLNPKTEWHEPLFTNSRLVFNTFTPLYTSRILAFRLNSFTNKIKQMINWIVSGIFYVLSSHIRNTSRVTDALTLFWLLCFDKNVLSWNRVLVWCIFWWKIKIKKNAIRQFLSAKLFRLENSGTLFTDNYLQRFAKSQPTCMDKLLYPHKTVGCNYLFMP